jgi:hypothetical protein
VIGLKGSVFKTFEELEAIAAGLSSSRRRKNVERAKLFIEKLSETSSQKSAQVKIYKTKCSDKGPQPTNSQVLYKMPQGESF